MDPTQTTFIVDMAGEDGQRIELFKCFQGLSEADDGFKVRVDVHTANKRSPDGGIEAAWEAIFHTAREHLADVKLLKEDVP